MRPAIYLTDPKEIRRVRSNQPFATSAQARAQRERLRHATEKFFADANGAVLPIDLILVRADEPLHKALQAHLN